MYFDIVILALMVIGALWTVMAADLLKSAIGLALASAILAVIMFRLTAPLAAVFELSVCAGLITVIFISVISLTRRGTADAGQAARRFSRYVWPLIILTAGIALIMIKYIPDLNLLPAQAPEMDMRRVLWGQRSLDLFGQVVVLLAGIFGVVVLFKARAKSK